MRIAKRAGIVIILLIVIATVYQPAAADTFDSQWFPLTRHFVQDEFLRFYRSAPDPLTLFGYPITDAFVDQTGHLTQYFQRARFDLLMTDKGPLVDLADLGWYLYDENGAPANFDQFGPTCRLFPGTGKSVCYAFLQFYDAYHGEIYFGDPISGAELRDGRVVQYFDNVRMEYLQNLPEGHRVVLTKLGPAAFDMYVKDPSKLNEPGGDIPEQPVIEAISTRAFVRAPLISAGTDQTIYVIVQDQNLEPVEGAHASITVVYPDGAKFTRQSEFFTGSDGVLTITCQAPQLDPRQVVTVEITAEIGLIKAKTATWFRIWY